MLGPVPYLALLVLVTSMGHCRTIKSSLQAAWKNLDRGHKMALCTWKDLPWHVMVRSEYSPLLYRLKSISFSWDTTTELLSYCSKEHSRCFCASLD